MPKLAYPDLYNPDYVFKALLAHGMFSDKLPPCFTSEQFYTQVQTDSIASPENPARHSYVEYQATRNTNVPRQLAIPHPESYLHLCTHIRNYWKEINQHIGKPKAKFNFCHVRKMKDKKRIFAMNYSGADKWEREELSLDYSLGCRYVVLADISNCFPSIYSHSIPWAVKGKGWSKIHQCCSWNKRKSLGDPCSRNHCEPCPNDKSDLWPNDIDAIACSTKDGETNGIFIGPHTSNIISEIILTQIDIGLQTNGFKKVIRFIDDYTFYAENESDARKFLRTLTLKLKEFELILNAKKTKIIPYQKYTYDHWISRLNQFSFSGGNKHGFTSINAFIDYALELSEETKNYAVLNYAIKIISGKQLSYRARRLYIKKILQIALDRPYILPLLEKYVFSFVNKGVVEFLDKFLPYLLGRSVENATTDALAYAFYFAIKYSVNLNLSEDDYKNVLELNDCVSMLLAYKHCEQQDTSVDIFIGKAMGLLKLSKREQDKFWLFLYEVIPKNHMMIF